MTLSTETVLSFAHKRNAELSFSYLKENGELLSIAASSGLKLEPAALEFYRGFYETAFETCQFFPQYFRFILGIVLDLEQLGFKGDMGQKICNYIFSQGYFDYETSDTRRLEILTLLERRLPRTTIGSERYQDLFTKIDAFISHPNHFIKFNKPLFYELTHHIFFLTDYGRRSLKLKNSPIECLTNIGILALLDDDTDLLAEICICFHFLGETPPAYWETYVESALNNIQITFNTPQHILMNAPTDQYHTYLVNNWLMAVRNKPSFCANLSQGTPRFSFPVKNRSVLSLLSESLYATLLTKTKTQSECLGMLLNLSDAHQSVLINALSSTPQTTHLLTLYSQNIFNAQNLPA